MHARTTLHIPRIRVVSTLLLGISLAWCVYWFLHGLGYWEDDAWIHLEFARSVSQGLGFAFNGQVVAGDTAPLWVLLLAGLHAFLSDWLAAGKLLTVLGGLFGLSAVYAFAQRMAQRMLAGPIARVFPAAMVLLVVINPYTCYWIFSGMEAVATAGLACWAVLAATSEHPTPAKFLAACFLAGIGPLLRPEMVFLAVLLAFPLFAQWRRLDMAAGSKSLYAFAGLVLFTGPLLAWSLYSLHAFGHLLPNTNAAKRAGPNESVLSRLALIYLTGLPVILCGAVAACVHLALHLPAVARSLRQGILSAIGRDSTAEQHSDLPLAGWTFVLWAVVATAFYLFDHTYVQTRYVLITAPGLTVVILALTLRMWPRLGQLLYSAGIVAALAVSIVIVVPYVHSKAENCARIHELDRFLREQLPAGAPVAVYSIGQIGFESQHPIIDTGGITRPAVIPYLSGPLDPRAEWAQSEGAKYYIEGHQPLPGSIRVFTVNVPYSNWTVHPSNYAKQIPIHVWQLPGKN